MDFVITEKNKPIFLIGAKSISKELSPSLKYLKGKCPDAKAYQIYLDEKIDFISNGIRCLPAWKLLIDFFKKPYRYGSF